MSIMRDIHGSTMTHRLLGLLLPGLMLCLGSCGEGQDTTTSRGTPTLTFDKMPPLTGSTGPVTFWVNYSGLTSAYASQPVWLTVFKPGDIKEINPPTASLPSNPTAGGTILLQYNFTEFGKYKIWANTCEQGKSGPPGENYGYPSTKRYDIDVNTAGTTVVYRIAEIEESGNTLWPDYIPGGYYGSSERNITFGVSGTQIQVTVHHANQTLPRPISTVLDLTRWTVQVMGGDMLQEHWGLDPNVTIISALDNVDIEGDPEANADGFTYSQRKDGYPNMCYLLDERLTLDTPLHTAEFRTVAGMHELGHGRGVTGDQGSANRLNPGHFPVDDTDQNILNCVMGQPLPVGSRVSFCPGHDTYFSTVTW